MTKNQVILLERCHSVLKFLSSDPDDKACERFMEQHDIRLTGNKSPRILLTVYAGTHVNKVLSQIG